MIWGEHLSAEEISVKCPCGIAATVEVIDRLGTSRGWFCREHAHRVRGDLRREEKLAKAIVSRARNTP
jgi:hypothetical protein